ncbi:MAG: geranylgeranyl reductase family protein [Candidatus Hodarchaeota archaeon]
MYDVVVVGCGPAGAMALQKCAELKLKSLGIEQFKMPRDKPCAGVIYPRVLEDFEFSREAIAAPLRGVRMISPSGNTALVNFADRGAIVYRNIFDYMLAIKAREDGAKIIDRTKVNDISVHDDRCRIILSDSSSIRSKYVIAADGVYSTICRKLDKPWTRESLALTLQLTLDVSEEDKNSINNFLETHYSSEKIPSGWIWIAERERDVLAGLGYELRYQEKIGNHNQELMSFLGQRFRKFKVLKKDTYMLPFQGPRPKEDLVLMKRIILTGDAGGFVRSDTGEGIYYAMCSGLSAIESIADVIGSGDSLIETYFDRLGSYGLHSLYTPTDLKRALLDNDIIEEYIKRIKKLTRLFK